VKYPAIISKLFAALALSTAFVMPASAIVIDAPDVQVASTGSGWCTISYCNNTNTGYFNNTYSNDGDGYRNWFAFDLSALAGQTASAATVNLFNNGWNYAASNVSYSLYLASSIDHTGLFNGPALGTVQGVTSGQSQYLALVLNADGLAALNGAAGGQIVFGGVTNGNGQFFGYTGGQDHAYIDVSTTATDVPEPTSIALFGLGLLAVAGMRRKQK
jgi:hypothetical protein